MKRQAWWIFAASTEADSLKLAMRKLWQDHVSFTREVVISSIAKLESLNASLERLLRNQDEIGSSIAKYYGEKSSQLTNLLKEHIMIATEVVNAAIANKSLEEVQSKWYKNADDIAKFLSSANINWSYSVIKDMLSKHLDLTIVETTARLKKDWKTDLEAYDENLNHMLSLADMLSDGIVKQKSI
jgi:hypothetical protein